MLAKSVPKLSVWVTYTSEWLKGLHLYEQTSQKTKSIETSL